MKVFQYKDQDSRQTSFIKITRHLYYSMMVLSYLSKISSMKLLALFLERTPEYMSISLDLLRVPQGLSSIKPLETSFFTIISQNKILCILVPLPLLLQLPSLCFRFRQYSCLSHPCVSTPFSPSTSVYLVESTVDYSFASLSLSLSLSLPLSTFLYLCISPCCLV